MINFDDFVDGQKVYFKDESTVYEAYKSKYTRNAFRLKSKSEEIIADISEIRLVGDSRENVNTNIQSNSGKSTEETFDYPTGYLYGGTVDSDADFTGIYQVQD